MGEYLGINPYAIETRCLYQLAPLRVIVVGGAMWLFDPTYVMCFLAETLRRLEVEEEQA